MGDNRFYFSDGSWADSIEQLSEKLASMSEHEFGHHVNSDKNDFATWIDLSLGKKDVADKLRVCNTREQIQEVLKNEKNEERVNEVNDLPPPTPPMNIHRDEDINTEAPKKKGFFGSIFSKKDGTSNINVVSNETELQYDVNGEHSEEAPQLNDEDIKNLREALGLIKSDKSVQKDFEKEVEEKQESKPVKKEKEEKHDWTSTPSELPVFEKTSKEPEKEEPITRKEKINDLAETKKEEFVKEVQDVVEEVSQKKEDIVDEKKQQALIKKFDTKTKQIASKYKTQINKHLKEKKQIHVKEAAKLDKKEESLATKYEKLKVKEESVEKQLAQMKADAAKYESLKDMKSKLEETIEELAQAKEEAQNKTKESESILKEKTKQLDKLEKQINQAEGKFNDVTKRSDQILKRIKIKEDALKQKEKKVKDLLEQEKKVYAKLGSIKLAPASMERKQEKVFSEELEDELDFGKEFETQGNSVEPDSSSVIIDRINDCKQMIEERNFEDAKLLYNELTQEFKTLNLEGEEKEKIRHELREIYDEICLKIMSN